jgi:2,4-dienoyl-CoA reductase-like NADH-dependent reductase (Old Yellow Enzyme family)
MPYEHVMSPLAINNLTLRNRLVRGPHSVGSPWVDESEELLEYHLES